MSLLTNVFGKFGVDVGDFDEVEQGLMVAFLLGTVTTLGIGQIALYGYSLSEQLFTLFGGTFTLGHVLAGGALVLLAFRESFSSMDDVRVLTTFEQGMLVSTGLMVLVGPFVPELQSAVTETDMHRTAALMVQSAGFYVIGKSTGN